MLKVRHETNNIELSLLAEVGDKFEIVNVEKDVTIEISPALKLNHDYNPEDYSLFIFYNNNHPENEIYQVFEKDLNQRIGWIFPINSLHSADHEFAENTHFLRYATVAYKKLLKENFVESKNPFYDPEKEYMVSDFYAENSVFLVVSNAAISGLEDFNINNYYPSLYYYGFSLVEDSLIPLRNTHENKKIKLIKTKRIFKEDIFLHQLFMELLPRSNHHLVTFHLLYQVIELIIEKIFHLEFKKTLSQIEELNITLFEIKDKLSELTSEQSRISKLFGTYFHDDSSQKENLHINCNELLTNCNLPTHNYLNKSLYKVRNLLVHSYRNLPSTSIDTLNQINSNFEIVLVYILTKIEEME